MKKQRPLIGITTRHELATERFYLARYYGEAVQGAGCAPVYIPLIADAAYIESIASRLDGVLLPGSDSDVDPLLYGREPHPKLGSVHALRDQTDLLLLRAAEERRLPILAICYGLQVWNVFRGGTLIQDIGAQTSSTIKHEQGAPRARPSHGVKLNPESFLARLAGAERAFVNSHHHQAIEEVGRDLRATAWSSDGLVEAVEETREGHWGIGVQWHPELGWETNELSRALFGEFAHAASDNVG
jgi:putative glutamine amidotransferase